MKYLFFTLPLALYFSCASPKTYQIHFKVELPKSMEADKVYLQGDVAPLSWNEGYAIEDKDGDGTYEAKIEFVTKKKRLNYKLRAGDTWELNGADNRSLWFKSEGLSVSTLFDEYRYSTKEELAKLTYTPVQIKEDVAALQKTIQYVHPNLYKYRSKADLEKDFQQLEKAMLAEPTLINAYKQVSKFAAKIACSHTFTNPWNQGGLTEKAIFFQPDKVPFTFTRIGKRMFIDKNASELEELNTGLEILEINGASSALIFERLMAYVSADGTNDEKKLQRLTLTGNNKFELFDIFFPLEFGSTQNFTLKLYDHSNGQTFEKEVKAVSKTRRDAKLKAKYPGFNNDFASGWKLIWQNDSTAYIKMQSFAVFDNSFDWKGFLNNAFSEIKQKNAQHLILDIRGNEGGNDDIVEYLLLKILQRTVTAPAPQSVVNYKKLPKELRKYVKTWSKIPYNWGATVEALPNGQFKMKERFSGRAQTYKPADDNFQGKVYLLIDAENSSATQIMATYAKKYKLATLIGQPTGGNQRGLNGGYMFFHRLPNTGVEIDLPLISINLFPVTANTPNGGIQPDILVEKSVSDFINGVDTELQATLRLIH